MARTRTKFIHCGLRTLPADDQIEAAAFACQVNPANEPMMPAMGLWSAAIGATTSAMADQAFRAAMTTKYWGPDWKSRSIACTDRASSDFMTKLVYYANKWGEKSGVKFHAHAGGNWQDADVRVNRGSGGYYCYLGTDNARIPRNQHNMNLERFAVSTPDREWERVVPPEFGHYLGMPHEHMRPEIVDLLDPAKTIAVFGREQGWSPQQIRQQILTPINPATLVDMTEADLDSIMTYSFSGACTKSGRPIMGGSKINANDFILIGRLYPRTAPPPPPAKVYSYVVKSASEITFTPQP